MNVTFSGAARSDLIDIALYIAQDNQARALSFVDELAAHCRRLGQHPGIGSVRPQLGAGIRVIPHGRYLIFYRQQGDELRVERILHGARDVDGEDFE